MAMLGVLGLAPIKPSFLKSSSALCVCVIPVTTTMINESLATDKKGFYNIICFKQTVRESQSLYFIRYHRTMFE